MIPAALLVHEVTVVTPAADGVDRYGNTQLDYGDAATRTTLSPGATNGGAWLQQDRRTETVDGRDLKNERWLMVTNHPTIDPHARIEWASHPAGPVTFEVDGPTEPAYTPAGFHHLEVDLRVLVG